MNFRAGPRGQVRFSLKLPIVVARNAWSGMRKKLFCRYRQNLTVTPNIKRPPLSGMLLDHLLDRGLERQCGALEQRQGKNVWSWLGHVIP